MSIEGYNRLKETIARSLKGHNDFKAFNTVCGQISGRVPKLRVFARQHDIIIFVSGRKSSNGKYLYSVSKGINPATYFVSSKKEIRDEWLEGAETAGVSGATSTPGWMLKEVADAIQNK
jgi:4-hydroxy-3-methylbut-2-enyl diphosphate reductase